MGKCMKFIDGLYFGPKAEHNKKELVRKLKKYKTRNAGIKQKCRK